MWLINFFYYGSNSIRGFFSHVDLMQPWQLKINLSCSSEWWISWRIAHCFHLWGLPKALVTSRILILIIFPLVSLWLLLSIPFLQWLIHSLWTTLQIRHAIPGGWAGLGFLSIFFTDKGFWATAYWESFSKHRIYRSKKDRGPRQIAYLLDMWQSIKRLEQRSPEDIAKHIDDFMIDIS